MNFILSTKDVADLLQAGKTAEALHAAQSALQARPAEAATINDWAVALWFAGRRAEAEAVYVKTLAQAPVWGLGHYNLAQIYIDAAQWVPAATHLERALEGNPDWAEARYEYAMIHLTRIVASDNCVRAAKELRRVIELRPDWAAAYVGLGLAYIASSDELEAEAALRKAVELDPANIDARWRLASVLMEQDRSEEALPHLAVAKDVHPDAKRNYDRLSAPKRAGRLARYPRYASEFADIDAIIEKYILPEYASEPTIIKKASTTFGMGSCFALNVSKKLELMGVNAKHINFPEELNNTYANRHFLQWLQGGVTNAPTQRLQDFYGEEYRNSTRETIASCNVLIYSLGVAPCFFERDSGEFVLTLGENLHASLLIKQFNFRTTTVDENVENLNEIIRLVRALNPSAYICLTVSPVPLKATFEYKSAFIADSVSKSTLRVACDQVMRQELPRVIYWPAFEIVKWIGCHTGPVFGLDDDSPLHPNEDLIRHVVATFLRVYGDAEMASLAAQALALKTAPSETPAEVLA